MQENADLSIHNVTHWKLEKIKPYALPLTSLIKKFIVRFEDDISLEDLAKDIATGKQELWFILDKKEALKGFLTTQLECTHTGKTRLTLCHLAGEGGVKIAALTTIIEQWAQQFGVDEICAIARPGWKRELVKFGYWPEIIKYRKEIKDGWSCRESNREGQESTLK